MSFYKRTLVLGKGKYGKIYKAENVRTGKMVVLKTAEIPAMDLSETSSREIAVLRSSRHPNVVRIEDVIGVKPLSPPETVILAFEYVNMDLRKFMNIIAIQGRGAGIDFQLAKRFCFHAFLGLQYCHEKGIIHRDLRPQYLLFDTKSKAVKIANFSYSRELSIVTGRYSDKVPAFWYQAPEMLVGSDNCSFGVDVWSLGCILAEMIEGRPLFGKRTQIDMLRSIFELLGSPEPNTIPQLEEMREWEQYPKLTPEEIPDILPFLLKLGEEGIDLFLKMLEPSPEKRISVGDALRHPFFKELRDENLRTAGEGSARD